MTSAHEYQGWLVDEEGRLAAGPIPVRRDDRGFESDEPLVVTDPPPPAHATLRLCISQGEVSVYVDERWMSLTRGDTVAIGHPKRAPDADVFWAGRLDESLRRATRG